MPDLRFETLDPHAEDAQSRARLAAYADCFAQAFLSGRTTEAQRRHWLAGSRADDVLLRAVYDDAAALRPVDAPVATFSAWQGELNVGSGRTLATRMISDVVVEPTHRRRGILRRLMTDDLEATAAAGVPLAALTASEATIYGRFGFAAATRLRRVRVDAGPRFALRRPVAAVGVELLEPMAAYSSVRAADRSALARVRGTLTRPGFDDREDEDRFSWEADGPDRRSRVAVAVDASGAPTGYARFVPKDSDDGLGGSAEVDRLVAADDASYLALWDFLAHLDLVHVVTADVRVDDLLELALVDHRVVRTERVNDLLWLRVLDPVAALAARPWREDGEIVLEVSDRLDHAAGRFRVVVAEGAATVSRVTDLAADVVLDVEGLSAWYLGDRTVADLASTGRVEGAGVSRLAAMADHAGAPPWCTTDF